jgi:hypothetical protein
MLHCRMKTKNPEYEESGVAHFRFDIVLLGAMLFWRPLIVLPTLTKFGLLTRNRWHNHSNL